MPSASSEDEQPINTSLPQGGEHGPQLRPILRWACAAYGLAYSPRRQAARGLSRRCLRHRGRAYGARCVLAAANTGLSGRAGGRRVGGYVAPPRRGLVGVLRLRKRYGEALARVARRRDCAAFGYVVNRATSDRVQPLRFFILVGSREGCRRWPFRPWREGEALTGSGGATPAVEQP